jgi:hypothetical protein
MDGSYLWPASLWRYWQASEFALEQDEIENSRRRRIMAFALIGGMVVIGLGGIFEVHRATLVPDPISARPVGDTPIPAACRHSSVIAHHGWLRGRLFCFSICSLAAVELVSFASGYIGFRRARGRISSRTGL